MNLLDLVFAVLLVSAVAGGWRLGLIARVSSWIGALGGLLLATRLLPEVVDRMGSGPPLTRLFVVLSVLLLGATVGGLLGELVGHRLRAVVAPGPARQADHALGAVAGAVGVLLGTWLLIPVLGEVPGEVARLARSSAVLGWIDDSAPEPPDTMRALRTYLGENRFPQVFAGLEPAPDTGPPPSQIPMDPAVLARVLASTVNVESDGCGARHEGSGFAIDQDLVVTNAHVVAGADEIRVRRPDQRLVDARVVGFEPGRDLALLRAPGLGQAPLALANAAVGDQGVVVGYPGGQNTPRPTPYVVSDESSTLGYDIYNERRVRRQVLFLASALRPGDSGAPLVNLEGRVVGVAFAIAPDRAGTAYALDDSELRPFLAAPPQVGAGRCQ
ncbi:MAG TPA: MarP family serine protease [Acidimicrobiales bacterium]|nr:MarP family serine protease [Acidimicrobiales bacterium]